MVCQTCLLQGAPSSGPEASPIRHFRLWPYPYDWHDISHRIPRPIGRRLESDAMLTEFTDTDLKDGRSPEPMPACMTLTPGRAEVVGEPMRPCPGTTARPTRCGRDERWLFFGASEFRSLRDQSVQSQVSRRRLDRSVVAGSARTSAVALSLAPEPLSTLGLAQSQSLRALKKHDDA